MAREYRTFQVGHTQGYTQETSLNKQAALIARDVEAELELRCKEGWTLEGSPWMVCGWLFLTMRGD